MVNDSGSHSSDETQATQLLAQILGHTVSAPAVPELNELEKSEALMSDQSIPGLFRSPPEYHLHGLATSQTQTQSPTMSRKDTSQEGSGSQKENKQCASPPPATPTSPRDADANEGGKVPSQVARPPLSGAPQAGKIHKGGASFASPTVFANQSPQRNHTFPLPTNTRRAVSPFSQDSFARDPLVEDPGQLYLERHPQFNVTASQLEGNSHSHTSHLSTQSEDVVRARGRDNSSAQHHHSGMGSSNDTYDSQRLQSQQRQQSQSMDDLYYSSQHAQQIPSQEQLTSSQVAELDGLQGDTRAMLWSQEPSQLQPPSEHPDEDEASQYSQVPYMPYEDGVGTSGEMTQVVSEESIEATQPMQHVTTSSIAVGGRPLASTVKADRLNRLRGQGVTINTDTITHKVDVQPRPAAADRPMLPPTLPVSAGGPLSLKRPRSSLKTHSEASFEPESGVADKALSLSPPPQSKRARTSSPDIIPDSEPMYDVSLPVIESPIRMEDEADITVESIQDGTALLEQDEVTKGISTLDEVPESVEYPGGQSLDDDTPLAILFPPKAASPVLIPETAPLTDPDVTARPQAGRSATKKGSASLLRKGSGKRANRPRAPSPDKSSSGASTVQNSPHPEEFIDEPRPRTPSSAPSEDRRLPGAAGSLRGRREQFSRKTSRTRSAIKATPHTITATSMSLGSINSNSNTHSTSSVPDKPRVFAYWKGDRSWYSGIVQSAEHGLYNVLFDDDHTADLTIQQLRKFDLRSGDLVGWIQGGRRQSGRVHSLLGDVGQETVRMITTGDSVSDNDVALKHIKISAKAISDAWQDRILKPEEIDVPPSSGIAGSNSPLIRRSPSKRTTMNTADHDSMWGDFAFVLSGSNLDSDKRRRVQGVIEDGEGLLFEDGLTALYGLEGRNSSDKTWIGTSADIHFKAERQQLKTVFLLSNDACQKPKFLMALALGIPCIDSRWIEESRKQKLKLDWHDFILEAGHCDALGGRVSQQVNLRWDEDPSHMQNLVFAMTLFKGMHILVIGKDYVPVAAGSKGTTMNTQDIPRIILAMGAEEVEAVADRSRASQPLDDYTYVVSRDGTEWRNSVSWAWVKDCLIANRILPRPVTEASQDDAGTSQEV